AADYRHVERTGTVLQGASFGFNALELPRPIDEITQTAELGLQYDGPHHALRLGYDGSFYRGRHNALVWDNPYLGPQRGRLAPPPDTDAHQLGVTLQRSFGAGSAMTIVATRGLQRQDDEFLPYTINTSPAAAELPRGSLDGNAYTTHLALAFATPLGGFSERLAGARVQFELRHDERSDKRARTAFPYIVTDQFTSAAAITEPFGMRHTQSVVGGDYDLTPVLRRLPRTQRLRVSAGWQRDWWTRSFQGRSEAIEDSGWGEIAWRAARHLDVRLKWGGANREVQRYADVALTTAPQNPRLRQYPIADREREFAEGQLSWAGPGGLDVVVTGRYSADEYVNSRLGLLASRGNAATLAAHWAPAGRLTLFADHAWERREERQAGSALFSVVDWFATTEDRVRSASAGLRLGRFGPGIEIELRGFYVRSDGATHVRGPAIEALPSLRVRQHGAELSAGLRRGPHSLRASVYHEHFDADDYARDGVFAATIPSLLAIGAAAHEYDALRVTVSWRYAVNDAAAPAAALPDSL
ncbi:MAG: MtrB/PioB family outer membrane beta-barrel protein, partial [Steroidobacteraceae bacterium]|nr:MtrB/PioB family outer membrane beta-barrel protein [Steroidobacteraceae bacterium]MDW8257965.1 MtrB/PioB family outer membrane beta-barrel protein [Gammaproteobacteria bacterium]